MGEQNTVVRTMTTLQLVVVGFFWTSGGFYGTEPAMQGPHLYILIFGLVMPLLYSLPTALISAELATNYPETGGQCVYVELACGTLIGAHNTWWVWFSTTVDAGLYPQYIRDTLKAQFLTNGTDVNSTLTGISNSTGDNDGPIPEYIYEWIPMMVIAFVTCINIISIDFLMKFEMFLGIMAALPCLAFIGVGIPHIDLHECFTTDRTLDWSSAISDSLWLYGGFTNLGVLAGECKTPKRSYLIAVAFLVPLKILLRFVPFLIAFTFNPTSDQLETTGYFGTVAQTVGTFHGVAGDWLRIWYFAGSLICFLGFYNAMALNAERTMYFFCNERFAKTFKKLANGNCLLQFFFKVPSAGGIPRIYILFVALVEMGMVNLNVNLLIELEMLIYAIPAGLFFYSFVYLRLQRQRLAKMSTHGINPNSTTPLLGNTINSSDDDTEKQGQEDPSQMVYNISGGNVVAFGLAIFPVVAFAADTVFNLMDKNDGGTAPFDYFKLVVFFAVIAVGFMGQFAYGWCIGYDDTTNNKAIEAKQANTYE